MSEMHVMFVTADDRIVRMVELSAVPAVGDLVETGDARWAVLSVRWIVSEDESPKAVLTVEMREDLGSAAEESQISTPGPFSVLPMHTTPPWEFQIKRIADLDPHASPP